MTLVSVIKSGLTVAGVIWIFWKLVVLPGTEWEKTIYEWWQEGDDSPKGE